MLQITTLPHKYAQLFKKNNLKKYMLFDNKNMGLYFAGLKLELRSQCIWDFFVVDSTTSPPRGHGPY